MPYKNDTYSFKIQEHELSTSSIFKFSQKQNNNVTFQKRRSFHF